MSRELPPPMSAADTAMMTVMADIDRHLPPTQIVELARTPADLRSFIRQCDALKSAAERKLLELERPST